MSMFNIHAACENEEEDDNQATSEKDEENEKFRYRTNLRDIYHHRVREILKKIS